jgi:hypothetical protein
MGRIGHADCVTDVSQRVPDRAMAKKVKVRPVQGNGAREALLNCALLVGEGLFRLLLQITDA